MELRNWAGNLSYDARVCYYPSSVGEVEELVVRNRRVKALGTRHSFSPVAATPGGALISLSRLAPEITVDRDEMTVSVTGGTTYGVLAAVLEKGGFALNNMGSLPHISIAGATATGTHGSGDDNGILATSVAAIEIVRADGSTLVVDRSNPDLAALAVGLGAFGIVTRLEFDIQSSYLVRQDVYRDVAWAAVLESLDEVMASAYSVSLMADFGSPVVKAMWQKKLVAPDADSAAPRLLHGGTWVDDADLPSDHNLNVRAGIPGPWSERLPHFRLDSEPSAGGDELQTEYFVDRRHGVAALNTLRTMGDRISPHLNTAEIRTTAADNLWLSPAYRRPSLCIGFTWRKHPREVAALLPEIEAMLAPYEPRPHWGKLFSFIDLDISQQFPCLRHFVELADHYDPKGKFSNPFLRRLRQASSPDG